MKLKSLLIPLLLITNSITAQQITCSAKDKEIFTQKIALLKKGYTPTADFGKIVVYVGKTFLGTPYVAKTLEIGTKESLVINLQGLDCTTFVENVLAFGLLLKNNKEDFEAYTKYLEKIRYKDGILNGYTSRLHYFSEWISNNQQKGIIKNNTADIGGVEIEKEINFMSTHRDLYPFLKEGKNFEGILQSEKAVSKSPFCFLPKEEVKENEGSIAPGDIIALTTSIKGLDITHTGIATREKDGRIHLLHASTKGQVEISDLPLAEYLQKIKNNTGIMVSRPQ